jgi:hypothetical protein
VHQDVDRPEALFNLREHLVELSVVGDIARFDELNAKFFCQRHDALFHRQRVGERELSALRVHRLRDPPADRAVVRDSEDESGFAIEFAHPRSVAAARETKKAKPERKR